MTCYTVVDSSGMELLHPLREGRWAPQIGQQGKSQRRGIVGVKMCWIINQDGGVVHWQGTTANACDHVFWPLLKQYEAPTITLSELGFRAQDGVPEKVKLCQKRTWSERGRSETICSLVSESGALKQLFHRQEVPLEAPLCDLAVVFNLLLAMAGTPAAHRMLPVLKDFAL